MLLFITHFIILIYLVTQSICIFYSYLLSKNLLTKIILCFILYDLFLSLRVSLFNHKPNFYHIIQLFK